MPISKEAKKQFLNKPLENWNWMKELSPEAVKEEVHKLCGDFKFKTTPYDHQYVSFLLGLYNKAFYYMLPMGAGKTKVTLDLFSYYKKINELDKALILVPNTTSIANWIPEIETHSDLDYTPLLGTTEERWDTLRNTDSTLYLLNYTGLLVMLTDSVPSKKGKNQWVPVEALVKEFRKKFNGITADELHLMKNPQSLTFKLCNKLSKTSDFIYGLSGTPMGRNPIDLWSQFFFVDRGETLGEHIGIFRECFFKEKPKYWGGVDYIFIKTLTPKLNKRIGNKSIRYEEHELKDLPPVISKIIPLVMPPETWEYYSNLVNGLISMKKGDVERENIYHKLRMLASGFVDFVNEDGDKSTIFFKDNPKIELLHELIDSMPTESKMVVFNEYVRSGDIICNSLEKAKIKHRRLYSGTKDGIEALTTFKNDPGCKLFVVNSQSGNTSLNLQVANYLVFFESPVSPIIRAQAEKRVHRDGQKADRVYMYDFVMKHTVEEKIPEFIKEGKDLFKEIISGNVDIIRKILLDKH